MEEENMVSLAEAPAAEETASWVWVPPDALAQETVGGGDEAHPAGFHAADQVSEHQRHLQHAGSGRGWYSEGRHGLGFRGERRDACRRAR